MMESDEDLVTEQLEKFVKRIPSRGFENTNWCGHHTLPKRVETLRYKPPYIPPQMVLMTRYDREEAKALYQKGIKKLIKLKNYLATTTVFSQRKIFEMAYNLEYAKRMFELAGTNLGFVH